MLSSGYISNGQVFFYEGVDKIYQKEFIGKEISSVSIPDTVKAIQSAAFASCKSLTSITIPDSVMKISTRCFEGCTGLTKVVLPSGIKVIDECVFKDCTNLGEIVIPDSVTTIADGAFAGCKSLSKVVLPKKLKSIGKDAFHKCPMTKVHIPGNVKSLNGFHGTDLEEVIIDEGVELIGEECFSGCASLTTVTLPESVKMIGHAAFLDCTSLQTLKLPKHMEVLEDEAFRGCSILERIDVPEGVTIIPHKVFAGCSSAHVHLSSTVKEFNTVSEMEKKLSWHSYFFKGGDNEMKSLSVSPDNSVFAIESDCLVDKQKRELLYVLADATEFPADLKSINLTYGTFPPLFDVEELAIPEGVTYLKELPFRLMGKLKKLVLPASLKSVSAEFFKDYPLSSVSGSPDLFLSNNFRYLPGRLNLVGLESVSDELKGKIEDRFKGNDWISVYGCNQLLFPAEEVLRQREENTMAILSICKAAFDPLGIAFKFIESKKELSVTIFDSLRLHYPLQMDTVKEDILFLQDVTISFHDALSPYITESSDPSLIINSKWKGYDGPTRYISSMPFPGVLIHLKTEQGKGAVACRAFDNLEKAYKDMLSKYGDKVEKLLSPIKEFQYVWQ